MKTNEMQEKQLKLQYDRMKLRKMPRNGALHAEHIYKQIKGWGEVENKRVLLRDLASLMQLGDGPTAEIFRRLKKAESEEKTKGEKDTRGTSSSGASRLGQTLDTSCSQHPELGWHVDSILE